MTKVGGNVSDDPDNYKKLECPEYEALVRLKDAEADGASHQSHKWKTRRAGCCGKQ